MKKELPKRYDAIYSLDVFEHISNRKEKIFLKNILKSLKKKRNINNWDPIT